MGWRSVASHIHHLKEKQIESYLKHSTSAIYVF